MALEPRSKFKVGQRVRVRKDAPLEYTPPGTEFVVGEVKRRRVTRLGVGPTYYVSDGCAAYAVWEQYLERA